MSRSYRELIKIPSFIERYRYLRLGGKAGEVTFGNDRYLNQKLYKMPEWKAIRRRVLIRDDGCDLGLEGYTIEGVPIIHHINPITIEDVINMDPKIFNMNNLISVSKRTHEAIHYGDEGLLLVDAIVERRPNDTCPWRK